MGHPDYRIHEMNRRLQQRMDVVYIIYYISHVKPIMTKAHKYSFGTITTKRTVITCGGMLSQQNFLKMMLRLLFHSVSKMDLKDTVSD